MNALFPDHEIAYRQEDAKRCFAVVRAGAFETERGTLVARLDAAVRRFAAHWSEENRAARDEALAALERYDEEHGTT